MPCPAGVGAAQQRRGDDVDQLLHHRPRALGAAGQPVAGEKERFEVMGEFIPVTDTVLVILTAVN